MVDSAARKTPSKQSGSYEIYSSRDQFSIGKKHTSLYDIASTVKKLKNTYSTLEENTVRRFKKWYKTQIKEASLKNKSPSTVIVYKLRGRPCLLGNKTSLLVLKYLKATRYKGGVMNTLVTIAAEMH